MATVWPKTIAVVFKIMSALTVPTEPSITTVVPSDLKMRKKLAVPLATAVPLVTVPIVIVPLESVPKVPATTSSTSLVWVLMAVFALAGCVPA